MKHIAGSGAKAGQWVTCPARIKCQLEGTIHADENDIAKVQLWKQEETNNGKYLAISNITREDYVSFQALPQEDKDLYEEMFNDKVKESEKRAAKKNATPRVPTPSELKAIANLRNMVASKPVKEDKPVQTTKTMDDGTVVEIENYSKAEYEQASKNMDINYEIMQKWSEGKLGNSEIVNYLEHLRSQNTWQGNTELEDSANLTIAKGLLAPAPGEGYTLSLYDAVDGHAAVSVIFHVNSYNEDVIHGVKKGSHSAKYQRAEDLKKAEALEKEALEKETLEKERAEAAKIAELAAKTQQPKKQGFLSKLLKS